MDTNEENFERFDRNLAWYSRKSGQCQAVYKGLKLTQIVLAALIPAISALSLNDNAAWRGPVTTGILGMLIVIIEAVQATFQPLEKWMIYRTAAEGLKREKMLYLEGAGPYDGLAREAGRKLFVVRIEELLGAEHSGWRAANRPAERTAAQA
jgi:Protein of unknown function (DUF4231)